jgi:hypothetical protein
MSFHCFTLVRLGAGWLADSLRTQGLGVPHVAAHLLLLIGRQVGYSDDGCGRRGSRTPEAPGRSGEPDRRVRSTVGDHCLVSTDDESDPSLPPGENQGWPVASREVYSSSSSRQSLWFVDSRGDNRGRRSCGRIHRRRALIAEVEAGRAPRVCLFPWEVCAALHDPSPDLPIWRLT